MTFKRFGAKDIVHNTIVTKPEVSFVIHSGNVYYQYERSVDGNYSNKIKHIPSGHVSLREKNVNRPSDSLIYPYIEKSSTRFAWKTISTTQFDDNFQFLYGDKLTGSYPNSASLGRIYIPSGIEISTQDTEAHANKKYIRSLKNVIDAQSHVGSNLQYGSMGTDTVNMITAPGIFYGSKIDRGSVELDFYVTGTLAAKATDKYSDGRLIHVSGASSLINQQVGTVIYNQGIMLLTSSADLHSYTDYFNGTGSAAVTPKWVNFGTGLAQTGEKHSHSAVPSSSYGVKFKGTNKIPTLTMYAYAKKGELNYSSNPTFTETTASAVPKILEDSYSENKEKIKKINKSIYADQEDEYEGVTYITKIGIYDKYKNLIAIASLANPVKKTEKRDFMFKLGIDF